MDPLEADVLIAELDGRPVGLVGWVVGGAFSGRDEVEIRVLAVDGAARRSGAGNALLAEAEGRIAEAGGRRAWLVTTNDNLEALGFYQRRGWRLADVLPGAVDAARRDLKPAIGRVAGNGIPIRDELILVKDLGRGR
jgi:ribosomal protein S18 acetylase RimI-like enzyme